MGGDNMDLIKNLSVKTDRISARVTKEELILIKKYAKAKGYENCSVFLRDLLNKQLKDYLEVTSEE